MISRRLIRIKAFQSIYAHRQSGKEESNAPKVFQESMNELQKALNLALTFIKALDYFLLSEIDIEREKYFPEQERLRRLNLLVNNLLMPLFDKLDLPEFQKVWDKEGEAINLFLNELKEKSFVQDYLVFDKPTFELSKQFILKTLEFAFGKSKAIKEVMDNQVLSWQDDKHVVLRTLQQIISKLKSDSSDIEVYRFKEKSKTEVNFGGDLCKLTELHEEKLLKEVEQHIKNWDLDRIAQTDQIIVIMAIVEMLYFKDIPVKVTINEYLEIAKSHSTPESSKFVNGILDSIKKEYETTGRINKSEKGLQ